MPVMVSARRCGTNVIYSIGPDVCFTPMGSCMVPVAYNSAVFLDKSIRVSSCVKDNSLPDFQLNSRAYGVVGHEPGTGKGVVVAGYATYGHVREASGSTGSYGYAVARDGDPAWINRPDPGAEEVQSAMNEERVQTLWPVQLS